MSVVTHLGSSVRRTIIVAGTVVGMIVTLTSPAVPAVLHGLNDDVLQREPLVTPEELGDGLVDGLQFADPESGLASIAPPDANSGGGAQLSYPLVIPEGRGLTPEISLEYDSGASSSWVGTGWDLSVGDISVDTTFGAPLFCPRVGKPRCGNYESETYRLDGDLLAPSAVRTDLQPRVAERADFTRKVETEYELITRHGDSPKNYSWEVRDKMGNIKWYGGFPDIGGPDAVPGNIHEGPDRNDEARDPSSILTDGRGNGYRWYLKAQRDVGVNMIRYEYDTAYYEAVNNKAGMTWKPVTKAACTGVCGKHIYLAKAFYTGAAELSEEPEAPAYSITFVRGKRRPDPVVNGRGGFLDVDAEQLTQVLVEFTDHATGQTEKVVRYDLETAPGAFGKTMLKAVHQVGCATGDTCTESTKATHTFGYYDDVQNKGFADATTWDTQHDDLEDGRLEEKASALGMSDTVAGDGHIYLGFNPTQPTKLGSFGGSLTFDGAESESLAEFMDINGDGLPDKVFLDGDDVKYRLNTSAPGDPLDKLVTFEGGEARTASGLGSLGAQAEFGLTGGIEAYFGVSAMFTAGGSWNWSKGYFADVNGDGLPDWVNSGQVRFNHLECTDTPEVCRPTFTSDDSETRAPLNVRSIAGAADDALRETLEMLRRLSPPVDTVRRWVAPYAGVVTIDAPAMYGGSGTPDCTATEGALLAVQHNGTELGRCVLTADGQGWDASFTRTVARGDRIYFRLGTDPDLESSRVEWSPNVTYTSFTGPGATTDVVPDENGLDPAAYDAGTDFDLAGRPNGFVGMPQAGTVRYDGVVDKDPTTDFVRPTIRHYRGAAPNQVIDHPVTVTPVDDDGNLDPARERRVVDRTADGADWCAEIGTTGTRLGCFPGQASAQSFLQQHRQDLFPVETGRFRTVSSFDVDAPVMNADGAAVNQDRVEFLLAVTSPIRATALRWVDVPRMCYAEDGQCVGGRADINPPVDTEIYPVHSNVVPRTSYDPPRTFRTPIRVQFDVDAPITEELPGGQVFVTVKGSDGSLARHAFTRNANKRGHVDNRQLEATLRDDVRYWFDVTVREPGLFERMSHGSVQISSADDDQGNPVWTDVTNPHSAFNGTGRQGYFGLGYRGWALAGYLGNGERRAEPMVEADLRIPTYDDEDDACEDLTGGPCRTDNDGLDFPGEYSGDYGPGGPGFDESSMASQFENAYAFLPTRTVDPITGVVTESWDGPKTTLRGTATEQVASRLGEHIPQVTSSGSIAPPTLKGQVDPSLALTGGVGPLTASFGVGWSEGDVDYLDMNGDGYPDVVRGGSIEYTDPRGGHVCLQDGDVLAACEGHGVGTVNQEITLAGSGGLSGSPVGIKGNARGKTNATNGPAAAKGGRTSKDAYSASVGAGVEIGGSWTSPVAKAPGWDDPSHGVESGWDADDFSDIPGDPAADEGTQLQRMIADVNGDGLPDQVKTQRDGVRVKLNLGYGFAPDWVLWTADSGFESGESYSGATALNVGFSGFFKDFSGGVSRNASVDFPRYSWDDVNGDGILDALYKAEHEVRVAFGTGSGVMPGQKYGETASVDFQVLGDIEASLDNQIRQQSGVGWGGGADFTIGVGPLCVAACYLIINPGAHFETSLSLTDVDLQDVNGDGYADSVSRVPGDGHQEKLSVRLNRQGRTGLLQTVTNPLHGSMELDYERKGNTLDHPDSTWVMKSLVVDDGRSGDGPDTTTSTFAYADLGYDFVNREDLGFGTVTTHELGTTGQTLRSTTKTFANDNLFAAGLQTMVELYGGEVDPANLLQRSTATWSILDGETLVELDAEAVKALSSDELLTTWATPLLMTLEDETFSGGERGTSRATATTYEYDRLGNATTITDLGDPGDPADDVIAHVEYSDCDNAAGDEVALLCPEEAPPRQSAFYDPRACPTWVSQPVVLTVTDFDGTVLRHRDGSPAICDNQSVTLLKELIDGEPGSDDASYAETQLSYDSWGSYNRIVYPLNESGTHYTVYYDYDPARHSDVASVTEYELQPDQVDLFLGADAGTRPEDMMKPPEQPDEPPPPLLTSEQIGLTSTATFDGRAGHVATRTDANGDQTSYSYDALGRLIRVRTPDGGGVSYEYHPLDPDYAYAVAHHVDEFHPGNSIDTVTFVDGVGRVTQQKQEVAVFDGVDGSPRNGFHVSGALKFDALGRVVEEAQPTFEPLGTAGTHRPRDAATPFAANQYDKLDRLLREELPDGRVTTTEYSLVEDLGTMLSAEAVTDPMKRTTTTLTDVRGYTRAFDDLVVGLPVRRTTYTNDLLGQLLSVESAGRKQVGHEYDLLGRRTATDTQDAGRLEVEYDAAGNQVRKSSSVQRGDGQSTEYRYSFGNLVGIEHLGPDSTPDVELTWGGYQGAPTADHGAGRVVAVEDGGRRQAFGYDENGRVDREVTEMVGDDWKMGDLTTTWDHDWLGRTGSMTYPDGETVTQDFDLGGALRSVAGEKTCAEIGQLTSAADATQTQITVTEFPNLGPAALPFTIRLGEEQLRVTARTAAGTSGQFTYTVERGVNGTPEAPTAVAHDAGTKVGPDEAVTCTYRYLDRLEYDLHGAPAFQQVGNDNRTQYVRNPLNRRLVRQVTTSLQQNVASAGRLTTNADAGATTLSVREDYAPPVLPFLATLGTERVRVTGRAPTAEDGVFTWTVARGVEGTTVVDHRRRTTVSVDRVQQNLAYEYDDIGHVTRYVNDLPTDVPSLFGGRVEQNHTYDPYYRLTSSTGTWNESQNTRYYEYEVGLDDATGNLTSKHQKVWEIKVGCKKKCEDVIPETTYDFTNVTYSADHQHRMTEQGDASLSYDLDGNVTGILTEDNLREMTWNSEGKMTMVVDRPNGSGGKPTYLTYDYNGEVAKEDNEQGRSWFVNPWVTVKDGTVWKNVFAGDERLGVKFSQGGYEHKLYFLHKDLQGSTNIASDRFGRIFQHQEYLPTGEPWIDEDSTIYRTPYQFSGEYHDEDHAISDYGQRWYDARREMFYGADPVVFDDPFALLEEPRLTTVYSLGFRNPVSYVDPDGRKPFLASLGGLRRIAGDMRANDVSVKRYPGLEQDLDSYFATHTGLRARINYGLLGNFKRFAKAQDFADKLDTKPLVEIELRKGTFKPKNVRISLGIGPQKKFAVGAQPTAAQPATAAGPAAPNAPTAPGPAVAPAAPPAPAASSWQPGAKPGGAVSNSSAPGTASVSGGGHRRSDGGN